MDKYCLKPGVIHSFYYGTIYSLKHPLITLVPSTYMNLSGKAVIEAMRSGFQVERMVIIHDDKDLPLGTGRLSKNGSSAGHNGFQSIIDETGENGFIRLRLGIGPFQRPLSEWVLGEWDREEWMTIEKMDNGFLKFLNALADNPSVSDLQTRVNNSAFWK
jgi:PTH1 family peptidyl-tRNA hydrolase